ncbi:tetratricopeptide repeat protein [Mucilaginibacter sp. FT3.2]|uniref:tetratricopeptide repeat protein n=1 Tax=Mucilaginibacter sp. FT3.2 TaxID=2723090 RepID=UPI00160EE3F8|nr:tetratricopeptide repeat protein [Mucilaginibacter sp. FT3.2]MBB6234945.1 tetratricopeptide (TPR) repeat protein [Mucilaginibacter sp. FT3.2]
MKRTCLIFGVLIFTLTGYTGYSQQLKKRQIDSLRKVAELSKDLQESVRMLTIACDASKKIHDEDGLVESLLLIASKYSNVKQFENTFKYAVAAESVAEKTGNPVYQVKILFLKGISYNNLGFYSDATEVLNRAIPVAQAIADVDQRHLFLGNIYNALAQYNERSKSISLYKKCFSEYMQMSKAPKGSGWLQQSANNLGTAYYYSEKYDSAGYYFTKALHFAIAQKDTIILANVYDNLGSLSYQKKQYVAAKKYFQTAYFLNTIIKDSYLENDICTFLAKIHTALNENEKAKKYFDRAIYLKDSLSAAEKRSVKTPLNYIVKYKEQQLAKSQSSDLRIIFITGMLLIVALSATFFYRYMLKKESRISEEKVNDLIEKMELNAEGQSPSRIEELKGIVQLAVNNNPAFFTKYNEFDPLFSKKLLAEAPTLTAIELEFCLFFKLSFETKEIARYNRLSVRAVEGKKYRIRKKLSIPSNQDISIWMNHI